MLIPSTSSGVVAVARFKLNCNGFSLEIVPSTTLTSIACPDCKSLIFPLILVLSPCSIETTALEIVVSILDNTSFVPIFKVTNYKSIKSTRPS